MDWIVFQSTKAPAIEHKLTSPLFSKQCQILWWFLCNLSIFSMEMLRSFRHGCNNYIIKREVWSKILNPPIKENCTNWRGSKPGRFGRSRVTSKKTTFPDFYYRLTKCMTMNSWYSKLLAKGRRWEAFEKRICHEQ